MSVNTSQSGQEQGNNEFDALDANNFIRGNKGACLIITETVQGEEIETVYLTVERTYFRVKEFGKPAKVERHTMSEALHTARKNGHKTELAAYGQSGLDIEGAIDFIGRTFEVEDKESKATFGLSRDDLDEPDDEHLEIASAPAGTSDQHGGGW